MTEKEIHLIGRIDQIVRDYFLNKPKVEQILAKELMPLFIQKGIFKKNNRDGKPIRRILRDLDKYDKLYLIKNIMVKRNKLNTNWYFIVNSIYNLEK